MNQYYDYWQIGLNYIIPLASILFSYLLGTLATKSSRKKEVQKLRYDSFYKPFMKHLLVALPFLEHPSELSTEARMTFFDLVMKNVELLRLS